MGEVANDPSLAEAFDVESNKRTTTSNDRFNNQKHVTWMEIVLNQPDQLRQRLSWALAQMITVVPGGIDANEHTEIYTHYYDIFVENSLKSFRDILARASWSPLMAEHLSYRRSKSHPYVYAEEDKRISRADENYARQVFFLYLTSHSQGHLAFSPSMCLTYRLLISLAGRSCSFFRLVLLSSTTMAHR
jgi:uncharacterized protein (DUF1800 family)